MKMDLINSDFYKLDGDLSDKLDYYLDHLELLRLIYLNQYITYVTKRRYSTRIKGSLDLCENNILRKIDKINILIKYSDKGELENALHKVKIFEKIVDKIKEDIPSFNDGVLLTRTKKNNENDQNIREEQVYISSSQFLLNKRISFEINEKKKKRRLVELRKLNTDMIILKDMFIDLQQMTAEQEPIIDNILENVDNSDINTSQAVIELKHAHNYQVNMFGYKLALIGGIFGALIGGPVGFAIIGTKIAVGVGATTCGVVGLFGGNHASKEFREKIPETENKSELETNN